MTAYAAAMLMQLQRPFSLAMAADTLLHTRLESGDCSGLRLRAEGGPDAGREWPCSDGLLSASAVAFVDSDGVLCIHPDHDVSGGEL
jgi:hypothetical protein